ncbi:MAG: hypothetical protein J3Q66DRAFT_175947, partial [Benniella sp.]
PREPRRQRGDGLCRVLQQEDHRKELLLLQLHGMPKTDKVRPKRKDRRRGFMAAQGEARQDRLLNRWLGSLNLAQESPAMSSSQAQAQSSSQAQQLQDQLLSIHQHQHQRLAQLRAVSQNMGRAIDQGQQLVQEAQALLRQQALALDRTSMWGDEEFEDEEEEEEDEEVQ